jgi:hypothetical protein
MSGGKLAGRRARASIASGLAVIALATFVSACGPDQDSKLANAAITVGMAAAAMPIHQAITGCVTQCGYGTGCDEETGTCKSLEELAKKRKAKTPLVAGDPNQSPAEPMPFAFDESCGGMCLSDERCVMYRGDLECVLRQR